jgi:hypothetical protein
MATAHPADVLRRAAAVLVEHGDGAVAAMGGAFLDFLATAAEPPDADERHASLEATIGFAVAWRAQERRRRRDLVLFDVRRRRYGDLSNREAARRMSADVGRYASSSWPRTRRSGKRPDGAVGDLYDLLLVLGEAPTEAALRHLLDRQAAPKVVLGMGQAAE